MTPRPSGQSAPGGWKYVELATESRLYDLENDPYELVNVVTEPENAEQVASPAEELDRLRSVTEPLPSGRRVADPSALEGDGKPEPVAESASMKGWRSCPDALDWDVGARAPKVRLVSPAPSSGSAERGATR